jgi:hypothetical protein
MGASRRADMAFVQIIEFQTSRFDEMSALGDEWEAAAGDQGRATRRVMGQDRDNPGRFMNIVFFESYEEAMENSDNPVTQDFSRRMMELSDGEPSFHNLDVVEDTAGREMAGGEAAGGATAGEDTGAGDTA